MCNTLPNRDSITTFLTLLQMATPSVVSSQQNQQQLCPFCKSTDGRNTNVLIYRDTADDLYVAGEAGSNFDNNYYDGIKTATRFPQLLEHRDSRICDVCTKGLINDGTIRYRYSAHNVPKIVKVCIFDNCYHNSDAKLRGLELCCQHLPCFEYGAYKKYTA